MARSTPVAICAVVFLMAHSASAEIVSATSGGFEVRESLHVAARPSEIYSAIGTPGRWWSSEHTYSGRAENLRMELRAGGCWCEKLPEGGSVQHMTVVNAQPGKLLRLRGALGPLQGLAVDGAMTWTIIASPDGTTLEMTYAVGGYAKDGLDKLAVPVDRVLADQTRRLKAFIETGSPEVAAESQGKEEKP